MTTRQVGTVRGSTERRSYLAMSLAILAAVLLRFAPSFFLRPWFPDRPVPPERFFLLHGAVFTAWFVLLVVQAALVSARRTVLHRRLGVYGGVLALVMVVLGTLGALIAARRPRSSASRTSSWSRSRPGSSSRAAGCIRPLSGAVSW